MKNEINNITMGSSIIDFYMEGYDEGKNDDAVEVIATKKSKKNKLVKEKVSARRKKSYYKSKNRQETLMARCALSPEREAVINGMLRNHQLPMSETKCELPCGTSIGNKRRYDKAEQKMRESYLDINCDFALHHEPDTMDEQCAIHEFEHNIA